MHPYHSSDKLNSRVLRNAMKRQRERVGEEAGGRFQGGGAVQPSVLLDLGVCTDDTPLNCASEIGSVCVLCLTSVKM